MAADGGKQMIKTRKEQALEGLQIDRVGEIVMVVDGFDRWFCPADQFDDMLKQLDMMPLALDGYGEPDASEAYTQLYNGVDDVASQEGTSRGNWRWLVLAAVRDEALDAEEALRLYGVEVSK